MHQNGEMTEEYIGHLSSDGQPIYHLVTSAHHPQNASTPNIANQQRETSPSNTMSVAKLPKKRKYDPSDLEEHISEAKPYQSQVKLYPVITPTICL